MGRKSLTRELEVWINGKHVGEWRMPRRGDMEFQYDAAWIVAAEGRPLSLSMPYGLGETLIRGSAVENYFDNLLPDSDQIRRRIQSRYSTESTNAFDLLVAIGRDCAGAVQLVPPGEDPGDIHKIQARPLSEREVEEALIHATSSTPLRAMEDDDFRISIAGTQEKSAFLLHEKRWCKALGPTPTTHIFKLPLGLIGGKRRDWRYSLENEWLCSKIIDAYGVPIAKCEIEQFGSQKVLIVERFDRQLDASGRYWLRLVQEDFCQALGLPSAKKYEEDGGPGILDIAGILRGSVEREKDLASLLQAQILFWMLAACDGHAKNFSIRILSQGRYHLTPLYDVLSYWPIAGEGVDKISPHKLKMAMAFRGKNKHSLLLNIQRRHMNETASRSGLGESAEPLINDILRKTPSVVAAVQKHIPRGFPQEVVDSILNGVLASAKTMEAVTV